MAEFFDERAGGYEAHMRRSVDHFEAFYRAIARPIAATEEAVRVLDIGCGTGLELAPVLAKVPNALVTGIDLSEGMLSRLRETYADHGPQITLIRGSYLTIPFDEATHDYAIAVMTLHHLRPETKRALYAKIRRALKPVGRYIEGDWVVSPQEERRYLAELESKLRSVALAAEGSHHVDVPLSLATQQRLLIEAGFSQVEVVWRRDETAVYTASA
jgi:tRNA (cmo5U34)-methyltransferase